MSKELTDAQILAAIKAAPQVPPKYAGWHNDQRIAEGRAIIAAHEAAKPGWMPIESAPLDTSVLLWWRPFDGRKSTESAVIGQVSSYEPGQWWNGQRGEMQSIWHATHWMPLPKAPD